MIYESYYFKEELLRLRRYIKRFRYDYEKDNTYLIDKYIFYSAFIIRKLIESDKLTNECENLILNIKNHPNIKKLTKLNYVSAIEDYELDNFKESTIKIGDLCNQIIHSYVFFTFSDYEKNNCISFLVSSDYDRNKHIHYVDINVWLDTLKTIGNDYITEQGFKYNEKKEDYINEYKK